MQLKDYKTKVRAILERYPHTRDSDGSLYAHFLKEHAKQFIVKDTDGDLCIPLKKFKSLPSSESVRRSRQIVQEGGEFLPTTEAIRKMRGIKEENWRNAEVREAKLT